MSPNWPGQATVTETVSGNKETITGMTASSFKDRWYGHNSDMNNPGNKGTRLSRHIWELKDKGTEYDVEWDFSITRIIQTVSEREVPHYVQ